mmetsp:Transcript_33786/g.62166  ORF Transcript_33786/g.62166 Transcript_33786/m.62166 type:complete len:303 (-) Transcript_33786:171-1079(-)
MPMLFPSAPEALVSSAIRPSEDAKAFLLVEHVAPVILTSIRPPIPAEPVDHRVMPSAFEASAITAKIRAEAVDAVARPRAYVLRAVWPMVSAPAFLLAADEHALKATPLDPLLNTIALLQVPAPLAFIRRMVLVAIDTQTMSNIRLPLTNVRVAIGMDKVALSLSLVILPLALVYRAIGPSLHAEAMPHAALPLARVHGSALESVGRPWADRRRHALHIHVHRVQLGNLAVKIAGRSRDYRIRQGWPRRGSLFPSIICRIVFAQCRASFGALFSVLLLKGHLCLLQTIRRAAAIHNIWSLHL